jgi:hypothetical protein
MIAPFLALAMKAPQRQLAFRRTAVLHMLAVAVLMTAAFRLRTLNAMSLVAYALLVLGIIEGAALIGWRLVQIPKSQALEFLLVSPVQPRRVFIAEALAGIGRCLWIQLAGLPVLIVAVIAGPWEFADLLPLAVMPAIWGLFAGIALTAWIYEPASVRRIGELISMFGVLIYLVVGLAAAENLGKWLESLPPMIGQPIYDSIMAVHHFNPFGIVRYWFDRDRVSWIAEERFFTVHAITLLVSMVLLIRAAYRLAGHFQDRHYRPYATNRSTETDRIGDSPLSWWAVRRVMEYSGRVNLYLAGGFCLAYAAYMVAGDAWPSWLGRMAFVLFEVWGGPAMVATAMTIMAAVPAAYQFGLWDPTVLDRCRRLELLLLTDLTAKDYWNAARRAAWRRGRGYLVAAAVLWIAMAISERCRIVDAIAAALGSGLFVAFAFTVGFRGFATGRQSNGAASLLVLGTPMLLFAAWSLGSTTVAAFIPPAATFLPLKTGITIEWAAGFTMLAIVTITMGRVGLKHCDADLRAWYDTHQGQQQA